MNIDFKYHGIQASNRLEIMAAKKLDKLLGKYYFIVSSDVLFKKENTSTPHTGMICHIKLGVPGTILYCEASKASYEASISNAVEDLERQLRKRKAKMKALK